MRAFYGLWVLLAAFVLSGCDGAVGSDGTTADETPDYRYRLTVEVEAPEGLKTGSSVIEVETEVAGANSIPTPGAVRMRARGEAVAVDMPDGRTLFALLRSENEADWADGIMFLLAPQQRGEDAVPKTVQAIIRNRNEIELPFVKVVAGGAVQRDGYPMLVTFGDLDDPTSVEKVDPKDLTATFGQGVALKRITVQITDDPVTMGIEERLSWLPQVYATMLDGNRIRTIEAENRLANNLTQSDFVAGVIGRAANSPHHGSPSPSE